MEKYTSPEQTLTEIRQLMERSSRFISLSGLSGVLAGVYALAGAGIAYLYLHTNPESKDDTDRLLFLLGDAMVVLGLAIATGILLTTRKAKKDGNSMFDAAARKLLINLSIPLVAGAVFSAAMIYHGQTAFIAPGMLIFYGLALVHASKYTRDDVRSLGMTELILGLAALFVPSYGLMVWALGFGVLHIIYGAYMYFKYEK